MGDRMARVIATHYQAVVVDTVYPGNWQSLRRLRPVIDPSACLTFIQQSVLAPWCVSIPAAVASMVSTGY
jgi:hypothetical protein